MQAPCYGCCRTSAWQRYADRGRQRYEQVAREQEQRSSSCVRCWSIPMLDVSSAPWRVICPTMALAAAANAGDQPAEHHQPVTVLRCSSRRFV
jgi:hypothetical protein